MSSRARRKRVKRIRNTVTVGTLLFLLLIGTFALTAKTASADGAENKRFKYYTSITVNDGDTLWAIADAHMSKEYKTINAYIKEVQTINHLSGTDIISGNSLVIPYYSDEYKQ